MLGSSQINGFFRTSDAEKAKRFYTGVLGFPLVEENEYVAIFRGSNSLIVGQKMEKFDPLPGTILGWQVPNMDQTISLLTERGVRFERYDWMKQDALGIWTSPDGNKVAWFKDPDGNVLSLGEP